MLQVAFVKSFSLVLALSLVLVTTAIAETRYVSDRLEIQMRTGKGTQFRILRMLPSGAALEVLKTDKESGYTRVRAPGGVEGWVLSRLLMKGQAARQAGRRGENAGAPGTVEPQAQCLIR